MKKVFRVILWTLGIITGLLAVIFLVLYLSTGGEYSVPETVESDPSIPSIEINGLTLHSEVFGPDTAEVVIVIHGGPGNDYRYLLPLKPLADTYQIVFYDQRGAGLSQRVDAEYQSLEYALQDLEAFVDHYAKDRKVNLIGHSWGAMLASGYLARHPDRVEHVVLAEPGMLTSEKAKEYFEAFQIGINWTVIKAFTLIAFESLHMKDPDKQARMDYIWGRISQLDVPGNPMRKYFCDENVKNGYVPFWRLGSVASQAIVRKAMDEEGNVQIDLVNGLEKATQKVLFLSGECNQIIGPAFQADHLAYFPNAEMVVIKGAGHSMLGEKPEECLAVIREYFGE